MGSIGIEHEGIISTVSGQKLLVSIQSVSACLSCQLKTACNLSEKEDKIIEVNSFGQEFAEGERVIVKMGESLGMKAALLAYILPFVVMVTVLFFVKFLSDSNAIAGISALASLAPYYFILYLLKNNLKKTFTFHVKKIQT